MTEQQTLPPEAQEALQKLEESRARVAQDLEYATEALEDAQRRQRLGLGSPNIVAGEIGVLERRVQELQRHLELYDQRRQHILDYYSELPARQQELQAKQAVLRDALVAAEAAAQELAAAFAAAAAAGDELHNVELSLVTHPGAPAGRGRPTTGLRVRQALGRRLAVLLSGLRIDAGGIWPGGAPDPGSRPLSEFE